MDSAKAQLADKIKASNNILVTVSRNPSVDQLSALLGFTLALNKMGKHAAAVFSGQVPSTLEFLQPEDTFEKNTDSLRDFIIALDKAKADKLRYKVEDDVVRIFITPYKTSISDADLEFSQGDFNVDVVVALGVHQQEDLDEAITAHGRILHDATVSSINITPDGGLGSINWQDEHASSLSELVTELIQSFDASLLDEQISTALLTGIVAETNRFSNEKTSAQTMSLSAALMAAGANQQLVATKLEEPAPAPDESTWNNDDNNDNRDGGDVTPEGGSSEPDEPKPEDGTIEINHDNDSNEGQPGDDNQQPPAFELPSPQPDQPDQPEQSDEPKIEATPPEPIDVLSPGPKLVIDPPSLGGTLTANSQPEALDPATDPLGLPSDPQPALLSRDSQQPLVPFPQPAAMTPPPPSWTPPAPEPITPAPEANTLTDLEASVAGAEFSSPDLGDARDEVSRALSSDATAPAPAPIEALNAQPFGDSLHPADAAAPTDATTPADPAPIGPMLEDILGPQPPADAPAPDPQVIDPNAPPPVPPPIPFNFGAPGNPQQ
ncbi:MAG: hypothetical protein JWO35_640 [Candidatus Saccharibacteria bacterium]|nr:hypothetical protein [Candidatus Saccharibacteria bacterium]